MSFFPWPATVIILLILLTFLLFQNRRAIRRLKANTAVKDGIFHQSSDLLIVLDEDLKIQEVSRSIAGIYRIDSDEYIGKNIESTAFWPTDTRSQKDALVAIRRAMNGASSVFTYQMADTEGRSGHFRVKVFPVPSLNSMAPGFFCIIRDVTVEFSMRRLLERRAEVEDIIIHLAEAANDSGDPRTKIPEILDLAGSFLGARRAFVMQTDKTGDIVWEHLWSALNLPTLIDDWKGMNIAKLMPFQVDQGPVVIRDVGANPEITEEYRRQAREKGLGSVVLIPLSSGVGATYGYMGFTFSEPDPPEDDSASILTRTLMATLTGMFSKAETLKEMVLFRQSVDAAGQAIALIDDTGAPIYANKAYLKLTQRQADSQEPIWTSYEGTFSRKVRDLILPMVRAGERWTGELMLNGEDEVTVNTIESFYPIEVGTDNPRMVITIATDITDRKRLEEQLIAAKKEAELSNRAKSDYLATMSHEIRTPMNAVIGLAYLALQTELNERQRDYLTKINSAAKSLLNIINDILDLSKIESGRLELENAVFSLDELLDNTAAMATDKAWEKGLKVLFHRPPEMPDTWVGDRFRLGQVLLNLVGNAIKFTHSGRIRISVEKDRLGFLRFAVEDTGIGMTEEQLAKLFDPFIQAEASTSRKYGGTGLGLTISRQIVELMNGDISVESRPEEGSRFVFTVALDRPGDAGSEADGGGAKHVRAAKKAYAGKTAFVVCSDPETMQIHTESLAFLGLQITSCCSVKEALENPDQPSLLLMDVDDLTVDPLRAAFALSDGLGDDFLLVLAGSMNPTALSLFAPDGVEYVCRSMPYGITKLAATLLQNPRLENTDKKGEAPISTSGLAGGKILLVDDNHINRQVGRELLQNVGLSVDVAVNGQEAVNAMTSEPYDLVLMDLHMPEMDGYEATSLIHQQQPDIPVIAMTASAMQDVQSGVMDAGFSGYVAKPIDPEHFYATISKALGISGTSFKNAGLTIASTDSALPVIEGIDQNAGLRQTLGNRDRFRDFLSEFADRHGEDAERIGTALESNDLQMAISIIHSLRGSAGAVGATELKEASGEMEESLRDGRIPDSTWLELFFARINTLIDGIILAFSPSIRSRDLDMLLDELEMRIRKSDQGALDVVEKISGMTIGPPNMGHLEKTRRALVHWDFDAALDALDDWRVDSGNQA